MKKYRLQCVRLCVQSRLTAIPIPGFKPGTAFEDLPEDWVCPVCGAGKDAFEDA